MDFRPIPFYFVNDTIRKDEVDRQLQAMQESGVAGFFLHARCGLTETGYGNKQWYDGVEYIIARAAAYGLQVWLYDEDAYPSGNAGGRIAMEHPEYVAQKLNVMKVPVEDGRCRVELGACNPLRAYGVTEEKGERKVVDLSAYFGIVRGDWYAKEDAYCYFLGTTSAPHIRSAAYNPSVLFLVEEIPADMEVYVAFTRRCYVPNRFGSLVDNLNKDCVDLFKKYAYESYYENLSAEALSHVRGTFTDEPVAGGMPPWTGAFESRFEELKGYKIQDHYFRLVADFDEFCATVRRDYWQVASTMFKENYVQNLHEFCKEKGIDFVGHFENEETPLYQSLKGVNVYEALFELDHSGFDCISNAVGGREDVRPSFGAKLASSVSVQKGNQRTLCEIFAVNPFNFGMEGMKKMAGWAMTFGADTLVPHAFYYGYSGLRKYDAGKSFFFQDPDFPAFQSFSAFVDRMARQMYSGESVSDTLLVYPNWEFADCAFLGESRYTPVADRFFEVFKALLDAHVEFDITDCEYVNRHFQGGKAKVGIKEYKNIVYLTCGSPVMREIVEKIQGMDARLFDFSQGAMDMEGLLAVACHTPFKTVKGDCREVNVQRRKMAEGSVAFLYNSARRNNVLSLTVAGYAYLYDADEDVYYELPSKDGEVTLSMEGYAFLCLCLREKKIAGAGVYEYKEYADKEYEYEKNPDWIYRPPVDCKACLDCFDVAVKGQRGEERFEKVKPDRLRQIFCADAAARFAKIARPIHDGSTFRTDYPVDCVFSCKFQAKGGSKLLFEEGTFTGAYTLYLNGEKLDNNMFTHERVYDFRNLVCGVEDTLVDGENCLEIHFIGAGENDGLTGEIYVI